MISYSLNESIWNEGERCDNSSRLVVNLICTGTDVHIFFMNTSFGAECSDVNK